MEQSLPGRPKKLPRSTHKRDHRVPATGREKVVPAGTVAVVRSFDSLRALERATALSTLVRQSRLTPSCGGHAPTAERTVGPARMIVESLTPRPGIREQNRPGATRESSKGRQTSIRTDRQHMNFDVLLRGKARALQKSHVPYRSLSSRWRQPCLTGRTCSLKNSLHCSLRWRFVARPPWHRCTRGRRPRTNHQRNVLSRHRHVTFIAPWSSASGHAGSIPRCSG